MVYAHVYHGKSRLGGRGRAGREKWMKVCYSFWCQGRWTLGRIGWGHSSPPYSNCHFSTLCCWEGGDRMGQAWSSAVLQLLPEEMGKMEAVTVGRCAPINSHHPAIPLFPLQQQQCSQAGFPGWAHSHFVHLENGLFYFCLTYPATNSCAGTCGWPTIPQCSEY